LQRQFLCQFWIIGTLAVVFGFHSDKGVYCLTSNIVGTAYYCCFGDTLVENKGGFDFCGRKSVTRNVDDVW
jgi:hypothetical protein